MVYEVVVDFVVVGIVVAVWVFDLDKVVVFLVEVLAFVDILSVQVVVDQPLLFLEDELAFVDILAVVVVDEELQKLAFFYCGSVVNVLGDMYTRV